MLLGGLNESFSPGEAQALRECFSVSTIEARRCEIQQYYATTLPPGPARLGEMIEESAFYSESLQRISANAMLWILIVFGLVLLVVAFGVTPFVAREASHTILRILLAVLAFTMSADVLGALRAHRTAAKEIHEVRQRLVAADAAGYPQADVFLEFTNYLSAIESAPESVPYAYKLRSKHLNEKWADYQRDRDTRRASK